MSMLAKAFAVIVCGLLCAGGILLSSGRTEQKSDRRIQTETPALLREARPFRGLQV
jgi:hypothetical protein